MDACDPATMSDSDLQSALATLAGELASRQLPAQIRQVLAPVPDVAWCLSGDVLWRCPATPTPDAGWVRV